MHFSDSDDISGPGRWLDIFLQCRTSSAAGAQEETTKYEFGYFHQQKISPGGVALSFPDIRKKNIGIERNINPSVIIDEYKIESR
jgi:hypothetical protein